MQRIQRQASDGHKCWALHCALDNWNKFVSRKNYLTWFSFCVFISSSSEDEGKKAKCLPAGRRGEARRGMKTAQRCHFILSYPYIAVFVHITTPIFVNKYALSSRHFTGTLGGHQCLPSDENRPIFHRNILPSANFRKHGTKLHEQKAIHVQERCLPLYSCFSLFFSVLKSCCLLYIILDWFHAIFLRSEKTFLYKGSFSFNPDFILYHVLLCYFLFLEYESHGFFRLKASPQLVLHTFASSFHLFNIHWVSFQKVAYLQPS